MREMMNAYRTRKYDMQKTTTYNNTTTLFRFADEMYGTNI